MEHSAPKPLKTSRKLSSAAKFAKKLDSSILLLVLGIGLIAFGGINYYRVRVLSFSKTPPENQKIALNPPIQITIPSIKIDLKVDPAQIKDGVWQISYENATFLTTSKSPGSGGNVVIYGHNKKVIFGNLPYLSLGQKIYIKTEDGKMHIYEAYKKDFVSPERVDLVSPTDHEELTIFTCWGVFDSQRVVIKARPVSS